MMSKKNTQLLEFMNNYHRFIGFWAASVVQWPVVSKQEGAWFNSRAWGLSVWSLYYRHVSTWQQRILGKFWLSFLRSEGFGFCARGKMAVWSCCPESAPSTMTLSLGLVRLGFSLLRSLVHSVEQEWGDHRAQRTSCWDIQFQKFLVRKVSLYSI